MTAAPSPPLQAVPGFERSGYALQGGRLVWAGAALAAEHPRHLQRPWSAPPVRLSRPRLQARAAALVRDLRRGRGPLPPRGLLAWLAGRALPFPLSLAGDRFEALAAALQRGELQAFESAALRLLGIGPGLTPSGDDLIGGALFALAHAPIPHWQPGLPAMRARLHAAALRASNPISAALLQDLMAGCSWRALHEWLAALHHDRPAGLQTATAALLGIGASSGADMLAGVLLALAPGARELGTCLAVAAPAASPSPHDARLTSP
jgi:hypothetical protein